MAQITNAVLLEKISNVHERLGEMNSHLERLNGQVAKNTSFRNRQVVINSVLTAVGTVALGIIAGVLTNIL